MAALYLLDVGCSALALLIALRLRMLPIFAPIPPLALRVPLEVYGVVSLLFGAILPMVNLYDARHVYRAAGEAQRVVFAVMVASFALAGALYLTYRGLSRVAFLYFVVVAIIMLLSYRVVLRLLYRTFHWGTQKPLALVVGAGPLGAQVARCLASNGVRLAGFIGDSSTAHAAQVDGPPVLAGVEDVPRIIEEHRVTDVIWALPRQAQVSVADLLVRLWKLPLRVYVVPDFCDLGVARTRVDYLGGLTLIGLREPVIDGFQRVAKRLIDLGVGLMLLLCALPIMAGVAAAVRLDSRGPVLFRQKRVGENGRLFTMFKFRTMVIDAEQQQEAVTAHNGDGKVIHKRPSDPRVTRVGRLLRRLSLDELPQLINVLRGEMSLVGPRPEMPWIVDKYDPWQYQRLAVPQGMTSSYVINGRSETPMHLNTEEDLRYINGYSLLGDLKILWKSMGAILKGRGAF